MGISDGGGKGGSSNGGGHHFASYKPSSSSSSTTSKPMMLLLLTMVMLLEPLLELDFVVFEVDRGGGIFFFFLAVAPPFLLTVTAASDSAAAANRLEHRRDVTILVQNVQETLALARRDFLRVAGKRDRLEVVVGQVDVTQRRVGNVLDVAPPDAELTAESVVRPNSRFFVEIDAARHLGDTTKFATVVHAE